MDLNSRYPRTITLESGPCTLRLMTAADRDAILLLAHHLPESDLLFMRRDITKPSAVDEWVRDIMTDRALTLLAERAGRIVGYGTLYYNQLFWNRHLGELRLLVSSPHRGQGLDAALVRELVLIARERGLEKVVIYMPIDDKPGRVVIEDMGFMPEAILQDWVKTRDERTHDLVVMSLSLVEIMA